MMERGNQFTFSRTDSRHEDYQTLVALLDADLKIRDGADHAFFAQYNKSDDIKNVILCYHKNEVVGCGAFKLFASGSVEIKRMFVKPVYRGRGIASQILKELEMWAQEFNFTECVLETGQKQPEAIALYLKSGYHRIPNYGQYVNVLTSVCMKKMIS